MIAICFTGTSSCHIRSYLCIFFADFSCPAGYFACEISEECIYDSWQCDYISDCTFNEDETSCGKFDYCIHGYFHGGFSFTNFVRPLENFHFNLCLFQ